MAKEIERKFLVTDDSYRAMATAVHHIIQGYISRRKEGTVRVRVRDGRGFLAVKGATLGGISRDEWEYEIPETDAMEMLAKACEGNVVEKERHIVPYGDLVWEVDSFIRPVEMTVAEVELSSPSTPISRPPFVGQEVSGDPAYYNSNL